MFADTTFARTTFSGNPESLNIGIECDISEAATASEIVTAAAAFVPLNSETAVGSDTAATSVIFIADLLEASTGSEVISALMVFSSVVDESSVGTDSALVAPSTFSAAVIESAEATETILALSVFLAAITEGAVAVDQITARLLWELIDDSQSVSWQLINTQE